MVAALSDLESGQPLVGRGCGLVQFSCAGRFGHVLMSMFGRASHVSANMLAMPWCRDLGKQQQKRQAHMQGHAEGGRERRGARPSCTMSTRRSLDAVGGGYEGMFGLSSGVAPHAWSSPLRCAPHHASILAMLASRMLVLCLRAPHPLSCTASLPFPFPNGRRIQN